MLHDHGFLRELVAMKDEMGVVSLYVDAGPRVDPGIRPAWEIRLRDDLAAIRARVSAWPERVRRATVLEHLEALEPEIARLVDPASPGLGRALFAPVCTGEIHRTSLQVPVGTCAVLESTAYVRAMIAAMATSAPAGVAVVSRDGVRLIDYRYGMAEDVYRSSYELDSDDWREMRGPGRAGTEQRSSAHHERFRRRAEESLARYLQGIAPEISNRMGALRWADVLLVGDPRLTSTLAEALRPLDLVQVDRVISDGPAGDVVSRVSAELVAVRVRRDTALVRRVVDTARSGGRAVLGLGQTLALLNEGRVDCLLIDENGRWRGGRGPDGFLYPAEQVPHGTVTTDEPDLGERMIERALESGAEVTVVHAGAAGALAAYDGVGALLRW
ncbi:VLRF1 family aeRF1-type release factor [Nonomuraea sp. NPDC005501]|uniref:VLRF1 family aeRF1-type release factor n=1 Tax=Nonomuraea sp. NPDC005501 TaxID=3156884 RepID=UPI0033B22BA7